MSLFKNTKFIFSVAAITFTAVAIYFTTISSNLETVVADTEALPTIIVGAAASTAVPTALDNTEGTTDVNVQPKQMLIMVRHLNRTDVPCSADTEVVAPVAPAALETSK